MRMSAPGPSALCDLTFASSARISLAIWYRLDSLCTRIDLTATSWNVSSCSARYTRPEVPRPTSLRMTSPSRKVRDSGELRPLTPPSFVGLESELTIPYTPMRMPSISTDASSFSDETKSSVPDPSDWLDSLDGDETCPPRRGDSASSDSEAAPATGLERPCATAPRRRALGAASSSLPRCSCSAASVGGGASRKVGAVDASDRRPRPFRRRVFPCGVSSLITRNTKVLVGSSSSARSASEFSIKSSGLASSPPPPSTSRIALAGTLCGRGLPSLSRTSYVPSPTLRVMRPRTNAVPFHTWTSCVARKARRGFRSSCCAQLSSTRTCSNSGRRRGFCAQHLVSSRRSRAGTNGPIVGRYPSSSLVNKIASVQFGGWGLWRCIISQNTIAHE
mmetsp:Transcript_7893/g.25137  ORF Transcript_7893/g.25137 Transcript_7893/m.25137 type:complete len:391 (+) Transcript_7893:1128-2300(+)